MFYNDRRRQILPNFDKKGLLPRGDYELSIPQIRDSILVRGPVGGCRRSNWDSDWRLRLVTNLELIVNQLQHAGVTNIYINGSFVENKDHPNDIDGYFECTRQHLVSGELEAKLNQVDPKNSWTWDPADRRPHPGYPKRQLPMWHAYRVEMYPHFGQGSGIRDRFGHELDFPAAFRLSRRNDLPKGIIKIGGLG
ncbi:MAG: hypothetical protein QNL91_17930 [Candidatus Krumholzibacteria bacterium]|nr:hypothetical protein [Candidatus Krumholzibacteria bacterium]